jgi:flagellar hook assembly protein FlgD
MIKPSSSNLYFSELFFIIFLTFLISSPVYGQVLFTRITSVDIVTDVGITAGAAWGDYNNDGFIDLFIANWNSENNSLYKNNGDGTFTKIITGQIVNEGGFSSGPSWGDYDNDGYLDLFVANQRSEKNFLYKNRRNGTFLKMSGGSIANDLGDSYASAWADYDNDGLIDLFVANAFSNSFLYKNRGNGSFLSITNFSMLYETGNYWNASWGDYNNDGFLDLLLANDGNGYNLLYKNRNAESFERIKTGDIYNDRGYSKGGSWGDYDNDGDLDLFVANAGVDEAGTVDFLYRNNGDETFTKVTEGPIVNNSAYSHGGTWGDFDNDGDLDLFVGVWIRQNLLYMNNGDGTFNKITEGEIITRTSLVSSNVAAADYDNDGDLDLFLPVWGQSNLLYRNDTSGNNWIRIKCEGSSSNKFGIGAKVKLTAAINGVQVTQMREITSNIGCRSQSITDAHFGLGDASTIDSVRVEWPSGKVSIQKDVDVNQVITIMENRKYDDNGKTSTETDFTLIQNSPNPFITNTTIIYSLLSDSKVVLRIYTVTGQKVRTLIDQYQSNGEESVQWDGRNDSGKIVSSGVYIYRLQVNEKAKCRKMLLIK